MKLNGPITDEQRRAIRRILTGQDEEPVEIETDLGGGTMTEEHTHEHEDGISAVTVLQIIQQREPYIVEWAVAQAANVTLAQQLQALQEAEDGS